MQQQAGARIVVCKFGGTSMADACAVEKVCALVRADGARRYLVVSAPGKRAGERKVTDLLIECHNEIERTGRCDEAFPAVAARFAAVRGAMQEEAFCSLLREVKLQMEALRQYDFTLSRGEYLSARLFAARMGYPMIDATELICFSRAEGLLEVQTERTCRARLSGVPCAVIPGFYGADERGAVTLFSRGGSDITGSLVAQAVGAEVYENWTDVDGILNADPRIVPQARILPAMTYAELRELSYLGASVMHPDALAPLMRAKIPLHVRNTFAPNGAGTIVSAAHVEEAASPVTGIAGKKDFSVLFVHKIGMNAHRGYVRAVLSVLESHAIAFEHMPSSMDALNVLIPYASMHQNFCEGVVEEIKARVQPDQIRVLDGLAIVSIVGRNMYRRVGVAATMLTALAQEGINVRMLLQGCREINVIAGVDECNYERAVRALYRAFLAPTERAL